MLAKDTAELAKKEIELAKVELRADVKREAQMAAGLGVAGIFGIVTLTMLFVAVAMALEPSMAGWGAALVAAGGALVISLIAGLVGWARRVKKPLEKTKKTMKEDVRWAKERLT